ncbi:MAG: hypothetical protein J6U54_07880, partial [Clostridiales bacterium]|nr:hypothetical protein [Clostridiales bacterium]
GFGLGGDWALILLLLVLGGGWGGFGGFGMGGAMMGAGMMGMDFLYPWLNNSQNINDGFRDAQLHDSVTSIRDGISNLSTQLCNCCGDMQLGMANGFNSVNNSVFNAQSNISQQLNANEIASLNRSFAEQTANSQGFYNTNSNLADLKYTVATENCADRYEAAQNTQNIITAITAGVQSIKDDLCADRLAAAQREVDAERRENVNLRSQLNMAQLAASQIAQNSTITDSVYNRLRDCPVSTVPVYGSQPIFTCPVNVANSNGCGCNGFN